MIRKVLLGIVISVGILALSTGAYAEGGGTGDGILYVTSEYATIQAAIDNADDGDIIIVDPGLYDENLDINVKVSIEGAGSGANSLVDTIIDPSGGSYGMYIHQPVNLKDLRVTGAPSHGIRVQPLSSSERLDFSNVTWENIAIVANGDRGVEIHNNTDVSNMEITNCEFVGNVNQGIRSASNVTIDNLLINDSNINQNNTYGLYLQGTVKNITISGSTIDDNLSYGIYMSETGPIENIVIEDSSLNGNGYWGFLLWTGDAAGINGFSITETSIDNNGLGAWIGADIVTNFSIANSSIANNTYGSESYYEGIEFNYGILTNVAIHNTNIEGNLGEGVANYGTGIVDATYNWWGDASGPYDETGTNEVPPCTNDPTNEINSNGLGDAVSDDVDYCPWLKSGKKLETLGGCISTFIDLNCSGLTGKERAECNHQQQEFCHELFGF